jgi:hypothetical protein
MQGNVVGGSGGKYPVMSYVSMLFDALICQFDKYNLSADENDDE